MNEIFTNDRYHDILRHILTFCPPKDAMSLRASCHNITYCFRNNHKLFVAWYKTVAKQYLACHQDKNSRSSREIMKDDRYDLILIKKIVKFCGKHVDDFLLVSWSHGRTQHSCNTKLLEEYWKVRRLIQGTRYALVSKHSSLYHIRQIYVGDLDYDSDDEKCDKIIEQFEADDDEDDTKACCDVDTTDDKRDTDDPGEDHAAIADDDADDRYAAISNKVYSSLSL